MDTLFVTLRLKQSSGISEEHMAPLAGRTEQCLVCHQNVATPASTHRWLERRTSEQGKFSSTGKPRAAGLDSIGSTLHALRYITHVAQYVS